MGAAIAGGAARPPRGAGSAAGRDAGHPQGRPALRHELLLKSRRAVPGRSAEAGFAFRYPQWPRAADELVHRAREGGGASVGR
ncbi:DUF1731 domain-containing protein [Streptomyces murinus]|uniref:DUF1731 domain-containing protein n=1 Tax=Streptomyces murinus TaxID=33900 RepID=UPI0035564F28